MRILEQSKRRAEVESYILIKPELADVAKDLIKTMVGEMPR